jgi:hypothetical protein
MTSRAYNVRGILIYRDDPVALFHVFPRVGVPFLDSFPPVDWSSFRHKNRVLRKVRGGSRGIVLVQRIGMFCNNIDQLLAQLWIWRVLWHQVRVKFPA